MDSMIILRPIGQPAADIQLNLVARSAKTIVEVLAQGLGLILSTSNPYVS
jgi:hypothetical protein